MFHLGCFFVSPLVACDQTCDFADRHCANRNGCSLDKNYCLDVRLGCFVSPAGILPIGSVQEGVPNNYSLAIGADWPDVFGFSRQLDKLKELAERFQELVFDRLKEKLPRVF